MNYDLEERTFLFAHTTRQFVKTVKVTMLNADDLKQMIRSSGSVGANYIEANEALSKKDFYYRIRIARKEAKETRYWLKLVHLTESEGAEEMKQRLMNEATELIRIFTQIIKNDTDSGK